MDEQLPIIQELWDPEIAREVREKTSHIQLKKVDKQKNLEKLAAAHEAAGGFDRLAYEANQDYKWFASRFLHRILPDEKQELDVNVNIYPAIPRSALDGEYTDVTNDSHPGDRNQLPSGGTASLIGGPAGAAYRSGADRSGDPLPERKDS